jgi:hypothetical protein
MRSIFVAALTAASMFLSNVASAEGCNSARKPLVTVAPTTEATTVLTAVLIETN